MVIQITALAILALVFLIGTLKPVHLGLLALTAAYLVGVFLVGEDFQTITSAFPVSILILLLGITYLFSIAREAGIVGWIIQKSLGLVRGRIALIPWVFFLLAILLGSMGSPLACTSLAPVSMFFVKKKIDPVLLGLSVVLGGSAGGFAPISLYGLITNGIAENSGIETNPMLLFISAIGFATALMVIAFFMFGGRTLIAAGHVEDHLDTDGLQGWEPEASTSTPPPTTQIATGHRTAQLIRTAKAPSVTVRLDAFQRISLTSLALLILIVVTLSVLQLPVDVGVTALALAMVITLIYPAKTRPAIKGIDWSTIMLVGGIVTYVGVLERSGAMQMLGDAAESVGNPVLAAFVLCLVGAIVSAFASTTGILGALIPLAIPLTASGDFPGYLLIIALALSSSLVDATPFSTAGATSVASAPEAERPRMTKILLRWGFSMIPIAPIATVSILVIPAML